MTRKSPFVHIDYLDVADTSGILSIEDREANLSKIANKIVPLQSDGTINKFLFDLSDIAVTSITVPGGTLKGSVKLKGDGNIFIKKVGSDLVISSKSTYPVTSISVGDKSLIGDVILESGKGISLEPDFINNTIKVSNTGIKSINGVSGSINISVTKGLKLTPKDDPDGTKNFEISLTNIGWDQIDVSENAVGHSFYATNSFGFSDDRDILYRRGSYTVLRGKSGVKLYDFLKVDNISLPSGKNFGITLGDSRISEYNNTLFISPARAKIDFSNPIDPAGTVISGIKGITPAYVAEAAVVIKDAETNLYKTTFYHGFDMYPLYFTATRIFLANPDVGGQKDLESFEGFGVDISNINRYGYCVSYDKNSFTIYARLDPNDTQDIDSRMKSDKFKIRAMFAADFSPTILPLPTNITSAPTIKSISLINEPEGGGFPEDVVVLIDSVSFADSYVWSKYLDNSVFDEWVTVDPFIDKNSPVSDNLRPFIFTYAGKHTIKVRGKGSDRDTDGPELDFSIDIKPRKPVISGIPEVFTPMSLGYRRKVDINFSYQTGMIKAFDVSGTDPVELTIETPILYNPTGEETIPDIIAKKVTILNLVPMQQYKVVLQAYTSDGLYSSYSNQVVFTPV